MLYEKETVLSNTHPVYPSYIYLANGKPIQSMVKGTVAHLKRDLIIHEGYSEDVEIRRCDIVSRIEALKNEKADQE